MATVNPFWETIGDNFPVSGNQLTRPTSTSTGRQYGYEYGDPFGDPNKFTRSTRESEIDRFNQWMRVQPWYQDYMREQGLLNRGPDQGFSNRQQGDVENLLRQQGINLPSAFHIDPGGNINQHNRLARNLAIGGAIGAGAFFGGPALLSALGGGGGGALPSTAMGFTGTGFAPTIASGLSSTLPATSAAFTGAGFAPTITSGLSSVLPSTSAGFTGARFASPVRSALEGPSLGSRLAGLTKGLARIPSSNQSQSQSQPQMIQQPTQPMPPIQIPFSLQTPIFNPGRGFGGFNVRPSLSTNQ